MFSLCALWFPLNVCDKIHNFLDKDFYKLYNDCCMEGKKRRIKVLFKIGFLYHKSAFDPLIRIFEKDNTYDVRLSCKEEKVKYLWIFIHSLEKQMLERFKKEGHNVTLSESGFDVVFTGDTVTNPGKLGRTIICFVNHGSGIKNIMYRNLARDKETKYMIFVEGDYREKKLHEKNCLGISRVFKVGMPKLDPLFNSDKFNRESILRSLHLDCKKKTVLYAPTYKPTSIFALKDSLFRYTKCYNLLIKLHPYSWFGRYAPHRHHRIFENMVRKFSHAVLLPKEAYSILPYLYVADTMITEASSTMFEFLATGKTGIIYNLDSKKLRHSDGSPILDEDNRTFLKDAFVHFSEPEKIGDAIEDALTIDTAREKRKELMRKELFYALDGNASLRVKKIVEKLLEDNDARNNPA